jgi:phospholipase/carboxylesterase
MPIDRETVLWSAPERDRAGRPLLVLLHGYGSHEGDLFQLAPYLPLDAVVAAPRAPAPHPMGVGWSWFDLGNLSSGNLDADPVNAAAHDLAGWLDEVAADASSIDILGFSQGGVVGLQYLRLRPSADTRLVLLASLRANGDEPGDADLKRLRPRVFWGRGTRDTMIPEAGIELTRSWLPQHSTLTTRIYEDLGHGVSDEELADVTAFLRGELAVDD